MAAVPTTPATLLASMFSRGVPSVPTVPFKMHVKPAAQRSAEWLLLNENEELGPYPGGAQPCIASNATTCEATHWL